MILTVIILRIKISCNHGMVKGIDLTGRSGLKRILIENHAAMNISFISRIIIDLGSGLILVEDAILDGVALNSGPLV